MVVLLPDAEQRSELRVNASFLKDFTNGSGTWERCSKILINVCGGI